MKPVQPATVHATLAKHYPPRVLGWVKRATWHAHPGVALSRIDMARRPGARDPQKVAAIAQTVKDGKPMPPVVLVNTGDRKLQIADGYHRTLGFEHAGKTKIPALIASGVGAHGPWEKRMHAAKLNLTAEHTHVLDLAGVCTGDGPCVTTPTGTGNNWVTRAGGLPDYVRALVNAFKRNGVPESVAVERAIGVLRNWASGQGNVTAATRARAAKAIAEWEALRAKAHSLTATPTAPVDLTFTEGMHPRAPKGATSGGQFVAKSGGGGSTTGVRTDVRDFQRRHGLTPTGRFDRATREALRRAQAPKTGGGSSKKSKGKGKGRTAAGAAAKTSARASALAGAVNRLSPTKRAQFHILHPTPPPGYRWEAGDRLVSTRGGGAARVRRILTGT